MAKGLRILLTGGGSGGHIYPLLAVAEEITKVVTAGSGANDGVDVAFSYLGPSDAYTQALDNAGVKTYGLVAGKMRSYSVLENILDVPKFFIGLIEAFLKVYWIMPDVIFSKGGTGAFAVVLAGWFYRIPIIIHESDAIPGTTNLLSARFAARVAVAFEETKNYFDPKKTAVVGNPERRWLFENRDNQASAKKELGFNPEKPLILVLGGSQGSQRINNFVLEHIAAIVDETQVLHQTGRANFEEIGRLSQTAVGAASGTGDTKPYRAVPYLEENLKAALSAADIIVGRAGSGTIAEIALFGKPAVLIPLEESAHDHQRANAYAFEKAGGAVVIEENNLLIGIFLAQVKSILGNTEKYKKMSASSLTFSKPEAARVIAEEILLLAREAARR